MKTFIKIVLLFVSFWGGMDVAVADGLADFSRTMREFNGALSQGSRSLRDFDRMHRDTCRLMGGTSCAEKDGNRRIGEVNANADVRRVQALRNIHLRNEIAPLSANVSRQQRIHGAATRQYVENATVNGCIPQQTDEGWADQNLQGCNPRAAQITRQRMDLGMSGASVYPQQYGYGRQQVAPVGQPFCLNGQLLQQVFIGGQFDHNEVIGQCQE